MSQQAIKAHQREINRAMAERGMPAAAWSAEQIAHHLRSEIARLSMPKPPGYEHLSHETIDAIRATSTKPK